MKIFEITDYALLPYFYYFILFCLHICLKFYVTYVR